MTICREPGPREGENPTFPNCTIKRTKIVCPPTSGALPCPPVCVVTVKSRQHFILLFIFVLLSL
ncbi:hypothetical protein DVH24_004049 [Malus domestica]|uniref:Uncharacterized protein n=1 Tax=Malus domestica TaxID=3750 RepID=A0A498K7Z3_MALDO|nr:hypothetical protein DVH24_004049 [Malus domestica]